MLSTPPRTATGPRAAHPPVTRRRARGVTYVEILVVLFCMALAALLVLPELSGGQLSELRNAAETLVSDMEYAQQQSMAHGDDCRVVVFDTASSTYSIAPGSTPATPIPHPVDGQPFVNRFGHGRCAHFKNVVIESCEVGDDGRIGFRSLGQLDQTSPATITLRRGRYRLAVRLDPSTGEASVAWVE